MRVPPVAGASQVTFSLHDAVGQLVRTHCCELPAAGLVKQLAVTGLTSGVYLLDVQAGRERVMRRLILD